MKRYILCLILVPMLLAIGTLQAAITQETFELPPKTGSDYWVVRSRAVSDLISFLTKKRTELKEDLNLFTSFLDTLGKADDFIVSDVKVPDDPKLRFAVLDVLDDIEATPVKIPDKPLSWEEMITLAMQMVVSEGYMPVDFESGEELKQYKNVLKSRENFLKKVRSDVSNQVEACLKAWFYLGTIDQQKGFKLYRYQVKQAQEQAAQAKRAQVRSAKGESARQRRADIKNEEIRRRQDRMNQQYQYNYWGW